MTKGLTDINEVIPVIEDDVTASAHGGLAALSFPSLRRKKGLAKLLRRFSKTTTIELDEMGSAVVSLANGRRNVGQIIDEMKKTYAHEQHLDERIIAFVAVLKRKGIVRYSIKVTGGGTQ